MFKRLHMLPNAHSDSIWSVAWGKNSYILTASLDETVKSWNWDGTALTPRHELRGHRTGVISVEASNSGSFAVSSSIDSQLRIWALDAEQQLAGPQVIDAGPVNTWMVAISPDDRFIATGSAAGNVNLYEIETGAQKSFLETRGAFIMAVAYSPNGKLLACGSTDGKVYLFELETGKQMLKIDAHEMGIRSVAFSPSSDRLLTASEDGHVKLYDTLKGDLLDVFTGHASWVLSVAWSSDNQHFASGSSDKTIKVWDTETKQCVHTFTDHADQVWGVAFDASGKRIVSVSDDGAIGLFECP